MTVKQKLLKLLYPLIMKVQNKKALVLTNHQHIKPKQSIYDLKVMLNDGTPMCMNKLAGKKILIVNTASACGFTAQYEELQALYLRYNHRLTIIGLPSNDFNEQEKGNDEEIREFCQRNFGVGFPLAAKSKVVKSVDQHPLFHWLTDPLLNGWNSKEPKWNFSKYLVNEEGVLTHYFDPAVSPLGREVIAAIET